MRYKFLVGFVGLILIVSSVDGALATKKRVPEFLDVTAWLNSPALKRQDILGKVALIHFWSMSYVESLRDMLLLNYWYQKYQVEGFEIIGIHTPQFEFEKDANRVQGLIATLRISYPIAIDNHATLWNAYHNSQLPTHYIVDARGRIRYAYYGEGPYEEQEILIQDLLEEKGTAINLEIEEIDIEDKLLQIKTPTIYLGYRQLGHFGNAEDIKAELPQYFKRPSVLYPNLFYLDGKWKLQKESLKLMKPRGSISIRYHASSAFMVLGNTTKKPIQAEVRLDGRPLSKESQGADTSVTEERSRFLIDDYHLYHLTNTGDSYGDYLLEVIFEQAGVEAFLISFGGPPIISEDSEEKENTS